MEEKANEVPQNIVAKPKKPPISVKAATIILLVLVLAAAAAWWYSYATNVNAYAKSASSYTQWIIMNPIADGGCVGDNAPAASPEAIDRAIEYEYIIKLPVVLEDDVIKVACEQSYGIAEALDRINGKTGVILDMQAENGNGKLLSERLYEEIKGYKGNIAVQSYDIDALEWFEDNAENIIRGLSTGELDKSDLNGFEKLLHRNMLLNYKILPYYIACDFEYLPNAAVSDVSKYAYVIAQNIKNAEEAKKATEFSNNICIDGFSVYET